MLTYSDIILLDSFEERLELLKVGGVPAESTFGPLRDLNQKFYRSREWKRVRELVIARDLGYDLAVPGYPIHGRVIVHHMNPLKPKDIYLYPEIALNPDLLITVSNQTHLSIHYGAEYQLDLGADRHPGDTKLW